MDTESYRNEKFLIDQLKTGAKDAYDHLFRTYHQELCNYMTAVAGDHVLAEEIAQQTFIKLWNKRKTLFIQENNLKKYLFKIAYHIFIDTKRKKKKEFDFLEDLKQEAYLEMVDVDSNLFEERLRKVETEIENLPEQCKKVFIMSKKEGLKYKEISERLNISIKTVEVHMARALKKIRTQLTIFF